MDNPKEHLKNIQKVLPLVVNKLNKLDLHWVLSASGSLLVHGLDFVPWDLDFFTTPEGVMLAYDEFKQYTTSPPHYFDTVNKKYIEFQMKIYDVEVEICEVEYKNEIQIVNYQGIDIPVYPLDWELTAYNSRHPDHPLTKN